MEDDARHTTAKDYFKHEENNTKKNQTKLNVTTRSTELTLQQLLSNY